MKLYNSLSRKLETFKPWNGKHVKMYVCGITPYDTTHLGHAATYMAFDVLQRYLKFQGYKVTYVQNVTDIDDDILKRAQQNKQDWKKLGKVWTDKFLHNLRELNIEMPTHYVKATETIETIITIVKKLETDGVAYEREGNVYFDVSKKPDYGKLSKYSVKEMIQLSKERGADPNDPRKKHPLDFILWQKSRPAEPYWNSPWGKGRPGWHIECSAMAYKYLDKYIDIHGGGSDLIYPHHESEIAQSEQFTGIKPFSNFWLHTGMVRYKGEKMAKSVGNLVMVSDLLKTYSPNTIRYLLLSNHYRMSWEFKESQLNHFSKKAKRLDLIPTSFSHSQERQNENESIAKLNSALQNDLNTPQALQILEQTIVAKDYVSAKIMANILGF